jgi:hypothetical protein
MLELLDLASGRAREIADRLVATAWSSDGTLRFVRQDDELWTLPERATRARFLTRLRDACGLALSPSGTRVAYLRPCRRNFEELVAAPLWVANLDGGSAHRIATNAAEPVWRPLQPAAKGSQ